MRITYEKKDRVRRSRPASEVRRSLEERGTIALNLIGSPGSGRTSLIERTTSWCQRASVRAAALVGSQAGRADAERIEATGLPAVPIVTGRDCYVTATSVLNRLGDEELYGVQLLLIENVGDLICPATHDIGESAKIALLSVPEGDDKPLKYPGLFERADLVVITKIDMLGLTNFDLSRAARNARDVAPGIGILQLSCRTGEGLTSWYDWLRAQLRTVAPALVPRPASLATSAESLSR